MCEQHFKRARHALWPANAPWYIARQFKPQCPHCLGFLRDRLHPRPPVSMIILLIGASLAAQQMLPAPLTKPALGLLLLVYLFMHWRRRERGISPRHRFAPDQPQSRPHP